MNINNPNEFDRMPVAEDPKHKSRGARERAQRARRAPGRLLGSAVVGLCAVVLVSALASQAFSSNRASSGVVILSSTAAGTPSLPRQSSSCSLSSVHIQHVRIVYSDGFVKVTGIVSQDCGYSVAVGLRFTGYYSDGSVAFTDVFYPNSTSNLPTGVAIPFEYYESTKIEPVRYTVTAANFQTF